MSREINPFGLRMPPELREQLEHAAAGSGRSLNTEIVHRLADSFRAEKRESALLDAMLRLTERLNETVERLATLDEDFARTRQSFKGAVAADVFKARRADLVETPVDEVPAKNRKKKIGAIKS